MPQSVLRRIDGSSAGPADSPIKITVKSPTAVAYLAQAPGALGLARAYVSGHLDVDGDMYAALARMAHAQELDTSLSAEAQAAAEPGRTEGAACRGCRRRRRRSGSTAGGCPDAGTRKQRDASAISHHYDVSNTFYEWVLGPSMAYTCACYPSPDATLEQAQATKFDLVARKLALKPGMRLLDVGCGWGGMVMHAAREYGVQGPGRHAVRRAGVLGPDRRSRNVAFPIWPRFVTSTTGRSPRPGSTRSARSGCPSTSARPSCPATSGS